MKINEFPPHENPIDDDLLLIWDATTNSTKHVTIANLKSLFGASNPTTPSTSAIKLSFASNGDTNGLFYWLGTDGATRNFTNPATDGKIILTASSIGAGSLAELCNRQDSQFFTESVNGSWVKISLVASKALKVNYYSIKTRNQSSGYYPRNWKLQGSNDDTTWVDLDNQANNAVLINNNQWLSLPVNNSTAYRHLRILVTDVNSSGFYHLVLGELEFYGEYVNT